MLSFWKKEDGQTLLIIVLIMVIVFTVAIAIATRNATNLRVATEETNSQQALSAAEAGIEQVLKNGVAISNKQLATQNGITTTISNASSTSIGGTGSSGDYNLKGGNLLDKDDGFDVWLISHNADGSPNTSATPMTASMTFYWGTGTDGCAVSAMEFITLTGTPLTSAFTTRFGYDACAARATVNKLCTVGGSCAVNPVSAAGDLVNGVAYAYKVTLTINNGWLIRMMPLYGSTVAAVKVRSQVSPFGPIALPLQGQVVTSIGQSGSAQRKITTYQGYPKIPTEFFPYALFCTKAPGDATSCN